MTKQKDSLTQVREYIEDLLEDNTYSPGFTTRLHLANILKIIYTVEHPEDTSQEKPTEIVKEETEENTESKVIISCDASITKNPGGKAATGIVIRVPSKDTLSIARYCKDTTNTNNMAEYDAIYEALSHITGLLMQYVSLELPIEIHTDSQIVANQINSKWNCKQPELQDKLELILKTITTLNSALCKPIKIVWKKRNSTKDLKLANNIAQEKLGVENH